MTGKEKSGFNAYGWVIFLGSAIVGLVAVVGSLGMPKADLWVIFAILSTVIGYCAKTYVTFQQNMATYQNLITQSMYDKQLDSGKGTLLHLCDDVIQQEDHPPPSLQHRPLPSLPPPCHFPFLPPPSLPQPFHTPVASLFLPSSVTLPSPLPRSCASPSPLPHPIATPTPHPPSSTHIAVKEQIKTQIKKKRKVKTQILALAAECTLRL
ncbi:hypothetical protein LOK49_LG14G02174 [Camellia lanceoleosa]|uniref:Uncharacterized protein n=1 Tax=Camellia lanceoleosa TaxID=1840588 RepID=A0ACC0F9V3_9ERIC|nr:hypothetical protein LOK49_LG14G02174 [Camellia lanceoleosa]